MRAKNSLRALEHSGCDTSRNDDDFFLVMNSESEFNERKKAIAFAHATGGSETPYRQHAVHLPPLRTSCGDSPEAAVSCTVGSLPRSAPRAHNGGRPGGRPPQDP